MNRRSLLVLSGTAVAAAAAVVALGPGGPKAPDLGAAPLMFDNLAARLSGAMRIEVKQHDRNLVLVRQPGDVWVLPDAAGYPVQPGKVRELLVGLTELRLVEPRTANPEMLGRLGLEDPSKDSSTASLLRVLDGTGGSIAELVVGRRRVRTQGDVPESVYVRRPDENQSWLAEGRLPLDADAQLWIERDLANIPRDRVLKVSINRTGELPLELSRKEGPDSRLAVTMPGQVPALEQTSLDAIAGAFEYLTLTDVQRAAEIPGKLLGQSRFELTDGLVIVADVNQDDKAVWVKLAATGGAEAERLSSRWKGWAYQLGSWKLKALLPRLEDLRHNEAASAPASPAKP